MNVILLERIARLGQMGEIVKVRDGYARNFLLPQGKALRANEANRKRFEAERVQLEARNLERRKEAETVADKLNGQAFVVIRQAGETGQLYGSVSTRDLAETMEANGFSVGRGQVALNQPIKAIGMHEVVIALHPEVEATIVVNVARSEDEAGRQARGEDVTSGSPAEEEEESARPARATASAEADEPAAPESEAAAQAEAAAEAGEEPTA